MILLIDNYDSFVHNLARYVRRLGTDSHVVRNDAIDVAGIRALQPCAIILSPGPCAPAQAGCSLEVVQALADEVPILGICLGHQVIGEALGGRIVRSAPVHGRTARVLHECRGIFAGLPSPLTVCRYHSLCVDESTLPKDVRVTARSEDGVVMGLEHTTRPIFGVQFHPESILTEGGYRMLANFFRAAGLTPCEPLPSFEDERLPDAEAEKPLPATPVTF